MFEHSEAFSTFAVDDVDKAKTFYAGVLGLDVADEMGGLRLSIAGSREIFVYPKPDYVPATYTVLNFPVEDIGAAVDELARHGVSCVQYDGFGQDERGIRRSEGDGPAAVAWFTDPAGNILSVMSS